MSLGKSRVVWIDQLRGFAFFCVLFSHLNTYSQIKQVIGSFHMPLFFIISGLLLNPERRFFIKCRHWGYHTCGPALHYFPSG